MLVQFNKSDFESVFEAWKFFENYFQCGLPKFLEIWRSNSTTIEVLYI